MKTHLSPFVSIALAFVACAQDSTPVTTAQNGFRGGGHFAAPRGPMQAVAGAPYSGEQIQEIDQSLADGTHLRHSKSMKVYRDSAGRFRSEWQLLSQMDSQESLLMVSISDPLTHSLYTLDPINKVAHRQELRVSETATQPRVAQPSSAASSRIVQPGGDGKPEVVFEQLGTELREGVTVEGERHTTIRPVGSMGNDHPMTEVDETWTSPELRLIVFRRRTNPITGEVIDKVTGINRSEPEAVLFQIPQNYTVVDEAGDFTISWGH